MIILPAGKLNMATLAIKLFNYGHFNRW